MDTEITAQPILEPIEVKMVQRFNPHNWMHSINSQSILEKEHQWPLQAICRSCLTMSYTPWNYIERLHSCWYIAQSAVKYFSVRDVTWMSVHSVHLAKWMPALEQVTLRRLGKCPFFLKPLAQVAHGSTQPSGIPYCFLPYWTTVLNSCAMFEPRTL